MKFSELVRALPGITHHSLAIAPDCDPELSGVAAIDAAIAGQVSYVEGGKFAAYVATTQATALILPMDDALHTQASQRGIAWVASSYPRLLFAQAIALFYQPFRPPTGIHPTAVVDSSVVLGEGVSIGAHAVVQAGVVLGHQVCIHPNVVVYPHSQIGDRTILHANCVIHERTHIGADCVIQPGAVIGAEGFGFVPVSEGWVKMEQSGRVVLEDGVEIGCNSTIDRPAVGETRIGRQTKLDNLVHIGHGCHIGEACAMAAQVGLAGGVIVGNRVILGGQVGAANQVNIGDRVTATARTGITKDVSPGELISGFPAIPNKMWLKLSAIYHRLPEMHQTLRQIRQRFDL
jgi:UDP-3-O-[3-hydroxymyristoyl] glucosamine N-acyltransferase